SRRRHTRSKRDWSSDVCSSDLWVVRREDLTGIRADGPAPYPGLVSLGRDDTDRDVLIDLEAAGGPVSVVGEPSVATEVVTALAEIGRASWRERGGGRGEGRGAS